MAPVALCHASSLGASCRWVLDGRLVPGARAIHVRLVRRGPGIGPRIRLDRPHDGLRRARQSGRGRPALSPGGLVFRPGSLWAFGTSVRVGGGHLARRVGERVRRRQHLRGRRLSRGSLQPGVCAWALIRDQSARAPWAHGAVLPYHASTDTGAPAPWGCTSAFSSLSCRRWTWGPTPRTSTAPRWWRENPCPRPYRWAFSIVRATLFGSSWTYLRTAPFPPPSGAASKFAPSR